MLRSDSVFKNRNYCVKKAHNQSKIIVNDPVFLWVLNDRVLQVSKCKMQQRAHNASEQMLSVRKKKKNTNYEFLNN